MNFYLMFLGSVLVVVGVLVKMLKPGLRVEFSLYPLKMKFSMKEVKNDG
jgi:hypothetical protein